MHSAGMKATLSLALLAAGLSACASSPAPSVTPYVIDSGDAAAVIAALEDYLDGFIMGQPELLERSLSPDLVKKGYRRPAPGEPFGDALPLPFNEALALAKRRGEQPPSTETIHSEVRLFEVADKTAAAKVVGPWGIDYVHLVKDDDGRWRIHHVIWQSEPERARK